jgi:hypothetical protein
MTTDQFKFVRNDTFEIRKNKWTHLP